MLILFLRNAISFFLFYSLIDHVTVSLSGLKEALAKSLVMLKLLPLTIHYLKWEQILAPFSVYYNAQNKF